VALITREVVVPRLVQHVNLNLVYVRAKFVEKLSRVQVAVANVPRKMKIVNVHKTKANSTQYQIKKLLFCGRKTNLKI